MLFMAHFAVNLNGNQQLTGTLTFRLRAGERSQRNRPQDRSSLFTVGSVKPFKGFTGSLSLGGAIAIPTRRAVPAASAAVLFGAEPSRLRARLNATLFGRLEGYSVEERKTDSFPGH
jgi:hypothetical protein